MTDKGKHYPHAKPTTVTVMDLEPGDIIERNSGMYTFVMQTKDPMFSGNQLTLWRHHGTNELRLDSIGITSNVGTRFKHPSTDSLKWALGIK